MDFVLVDIDGVVCDFLGAMKEYLGTKGIKFVPENCEQYNFVGNIGCKRSDCYGCFESEEFYKTVHNSIYNGALESLETLRNNGIETVAFTKLSKMKDSIVENRNKFLKRNGFLGKVTVSSNKKYYPEALAIFDDCLENHELYIKKGFTGKMYLINQPYNKDNEQNRRSIAWNRVEKCESLNHAIECFLKDLENERTEIGR